jgi:hypothetical protein
VLRYRLPDTTSIRLLLRHRFDREKPEKLIALSREALQLLPEQERAIRSVNSLNIGYAHLVLAILKAELAYKKPWRMVGRGNPYAAIYEI